MPTFQHAFCYIEIILGYIKPIFVFCLGIHANLQMLPINHIQYITNHAAILVLLAVDDGFFMKDRQEQ